MLVCIRVECRDLLLCDRVWVCVYAGGAADAVECGLPLESRCAWVDCQPVQWSGPVMVKL